MRIAPFNQRVHFEERTVQQDDIGNERSQWSPLFSRWASVNLANDDEVFEAGNTRNQVQLMITLRYDKQLVGLDTKRVCLSFKNKRYNILSIDPIQFSHHMIKLRVEESHEGR